MSIIHGFNLAKCYADCETLRSHTINSDELLTMVII